MSDPIRNFSERHPDYKAEIEKLAGRNSAFSDVCGRFGRLWDSLNELENEPVATDRIRREVGHLERELLAMVHDQMRV